MPQIVTDDFFEKQNLATRQNNPLNLTLGGFTRKYVDQGIATAGDSNEDGTFLAFQTPEHGIAAGLDLLRSENYSGLTVDEAMRKWSNQGYGADKVAPQLAKRKVAELSEDETNELVKSMAQQEGFEGEVQTPKSYQLVGDDFFQVVDDSFFDDAPQSPNDERTTGQVVADQGIAAGIGLLKTPLAIGKGLYDIAAATGSPKKQVELLQNMYEGVKQPLSTLYRGGAALIDAYKDDASGTPEAPTREEFEQAADFAGTNLGMSVAPKVVSRVSEALPTRKPLNSADYISDWFGSRGSERYNRTLTESWDLAKPEIIKAERELFGRPVKTKLEMTEVVRRAMENAQKSMGGDAITGGNPVAAAEVAKATKYFYDQLDKARIPMTRGEALRSVKLKNPFSRTGRASMGIDAGRSILFSDTAPLMKAMEIARQEVGKFPDMSATAVPVRQYTRKPSPYEYPEPPKPPEEMGLVPVEKVPVVEGEYIPPDRPIYTMPDQLPVERPALRPGAQRALPPYRQPALPAGPERPLIGSRIQEAPYSGETPAGERPYFQGPQRFEKPGGAVRLIRNGGQVVKNPKTGKFEVQLPKEGEAGGVPKRGEQTLTGKKAPHLPIRAKNIQPNGHKSPVPDRMHLRVVDRQAKIAYDIRDGKLYKYE